MLSVELDSPQLIDWTDYAKQHQFDGDLHVKLDKHTGMCAIIAIHSTQRGPALGGCRFIEYPNYTAAFDDAMRLAQGMSYKAALVGLPLGGGKAVIIKPAEPFNRHAYFDGFGRFVNELNGQYITALDSGTTLDDMDRIAQHTPYVASQTVHGNPAPATAAGVLQGIQAAVLFLRDSPSLEGIHVAIQGLGQVGYALARSLHACGARLSVADVNPQLTNQAVQEFNATPITNDRIHQVACDVFSPCALGGVLNAASIPTLQCHIIAGAANNQLLHPSFGQLLHERGILYAPDYVINAGGLIHAASEYLRHPEWIKPRLTHIHTSLLTIFSRSRTEDRPTSDIADLAARKQLE